MGEAAGSLGVLEAFDHGPEADGVVDGEAALALFRDDEAELFVTESVAEDGRQRETTLVVNAVLVCAEEFHEKSIPESGPTAQLRCCDS